ncbi:winged helix DNA-binding domain-containing [Salix suchowensis]|nr:winged helix DNA-binding domain-containing [Salix suchowensis]
MVASAAKTPTYAERAKKAQSIKAPTSIRPPLRFVAYTTNHAASISTPKSHSKSPSVHVPVAAGPSSNLTSQDIGVANTNAVTDHASSTASSTNALSPNMGTRTPLYDLASTTPGTTKVPVDNVWNRRKEQMVIVEDPFVVQIPPRPGPPSVHDSESWPEVGKSTFPADSKEGSTIWKEQEPTPRKGEKQKWVPIPAAELQAAADAQNQNQKSSSSKQHSRAHSRAQSQKGTNPPRSNNAITTPTAQPGSQNASRAASQAHSRIQSTTHSRIASRSTSAQSSPRLSRGGRKLEDDSSNLITNNVDNSVSNLNGSPYAPPRNINPPLPKFPLSL